MEVTGTTSRPRDDENSTVYLVEIPQSINEAYIIDKFSTAFGEVLCCEIGRQTRIGSLKFASHENAKKALAAESMLFSSDKGATLYKMNIKKKATATLFVEGNLESLYVTDIQNHLSKVFTGHWKCNVKSEIQDVLAFDCDFQAAEKTLVSQGISYNRHILTFYISVIYLEELPPSATSEKIANVFRSQIPTIGNINVIIRSDEGVALVLLPNSATKEQLLALKNIQIDNKKAMLFSEAVPKVYIEDIPLELFQQHRDILTGAIFDLEIFQGVITKVDLRIRERMAIVWLKDTTARCSVLGLCQSLAPILKGRPVLISAIRARPAIWEFDDEWYQSAQVPGSIDQYAADDPVFLRNWEPEIWKQWKSKYASDLAKAKDDRAISRVNQQIHGIRVTVMLATLSAIRNGYYYASEPNPAERITIHPPRQSSESFTFAALPPASNNIYNHTSVSVIKEDCLLAALSMKKKGLRPVVLNMASATSPGGGYRKGDGAQEENIFRRSNYFLSLDDPINPRCPTYPMAEFGGIYTPDVTVFRDSEDSGYAFRQEPFTMDFIAVAAYRKPWLQNNCLSFQDVAKTRRKIEAIFAIALHKGHDSLLLSALGCGAFQNPPNQIASIFLAVAQQYSRKFRKIVFAITEDHNSITTTNPAGNYDIFSLYLDHTNLGPGYSTTGYSTNGGDVLFWRLLR
ncbi:hypothetical protein BC936DRAFT_149280 [Jimgerdemannia flammicorona]|uniref:RRM domain-containing protein n=1 Tax=Jimgerdemannia flammicorona TaxID=994334 RepID=A0A433DKK3_9FUNG|nr:hypothetical protein BC936DRAFT_149280 [Jimgerdemannia flammicorona]